MFPRHISWIGSLLFSIGYSLAFFKPGPQSINLWKLDKAKATQESLVGTVKQVPFVLDHYPEFPVQIFLQPLDHFSDHSPTFQQRYWVNHRHYQPGGPVILLDGGETSGEDRLPFLDTGIVDILAKATGGLGVVLEHRYYGQSIPVNNFSTDSLRWLNNAQSLEDSAYFMSHVSFEGIKDDLTAPNAPWIYYGGSYAGARSAHMRVLYPDLVFGAIASSAVTYAAVNFWEYYEVIRLAAPECSAHIQSSIETVDKLLDQPLLRHPIKALFGLGDLEDDQDFAAVLSRPLESFQGKNWDAAVGSSAFEDFCQTLGGKRSEQNILELVPGLPIDLAIFNYAKWIKRSVVALCNDTVEECFGTRDDAKYQEISTTQDWRLWLFQVCTEWGYFMPAPPNPAHPRIISSRITLEYESKICKQAYPPGHYFAVPALPEVKRVNDLGGFAIAADRLAFIDGQIDPWRPATPHSAYAMPREDTISRPFKLIPGGVHHYDENGLEQPADEPSHILEIHREEVDFVKAWLKHWTRLN